MKTIYLNLLVQIIKCLISTINWEMIRNTVEELMDDTSLTGAQKRDVVLSRLSFLAKEFGVSLLNLTVEVAVQKMKQSTTPLLKTAGLVGFKRFYRSSRNFFLEDYSI